MSRIIIGIHGLENKPPKKQLREWWIKSIDEGLTLIGKKDLPYKFELVYWADIFHNKPLDSSISDVNDPYFLEEPYVKSLNNLSTTENSTKKMILNYLEHQMDKIFLNDDLTPNFTFLSDFIFKKYFAELSEYYKVKQETDTEQVTTFKDSVRNRLAEILKKHEKREILLIAHSMGSIIAYDVLMFLVPEIKINTLITIGSPLGMSVILSKIAEEMREKKLNYKKPQTPDNVKNAWYNFADIDDKVAMNYNLADDYDKNNAGIKVIDNLVTNDYIINNERNAHKSFGYLRTKELSEVTADFIINGFNKFDLIKYNTTQKFKKLFNKIIN